MPDDLVVFALLERYVGWDGQRRRFTGEFAVTHTSVSSGMFDVAALRCARRPRNIPGQRRGCDQHLAGRSPGFAHGVPRSADAGAASGGLIAEERAGSGLLDGNLLPVGFEFFGEDHGQRGAHALTHLGACDHDGDFVVGRDAQISVRREGFLARSRFMREVEADDQSCAGCDSGGYEFAAGKWAHREPPLPAARCTALRIRS